MSWKWSLDIKLWYYKENIRWMENEITVICDTVKKEAIVIGKNWNMVIHDNVKRKNHVIVMNQNMAKWLQWCKIYWKDINKHFMKAIKTFNMMLSINA